MKYLPYVRAVMLIAVSVLVLTGCISIKTDGKNNQPRVDLGWFRSVDNGVTWQHRVAIAATKDRPTLSGTNILKVLQDPGDPITFYTLTDSRGLLWSYDQMASWQQGREFVTGRVDSLAIDPQDNCTLYVGQGRTIFKSENCARSWKKMYFDTRSNIIFSTVLVDRVNPSLVYAGNAQGEFLRSFNAGADWQTVKRFNNPIIEMRSYEADPSLIFVITQSAGIFTSRNGGTDWEDFNEALTSFRGSLNYKSLVINPFDLNFMLYLSNYGILRSRDGGTTWQSVSLNTPRASTQIFSIAFNPKNPEELFYTTANVFYHSTDGGENWNTQNLPTTGEPRLLFMDADDIPTLYLGAYRPAPRR